MSCLNVEILLACYQGEGFLSSQLDSLLSQSFSHFQILARDDGSDDNTQGILEEYARRYPGKIAILPGGRRLGILGNFNALLEKAKGDIIFFCDQDDIWKKDKVKKTVEAFKRTEIPLLLHTDLEIADEKGVCIQRSFWEYSHLDPSKGNSLNRLLVQNHATGCTMAFNRTLRDLAYPIPKEAIMHDWWMSLIAASCGQIIALPEKTVAYRQHSKNALGARRIGWKDGLKKFMSFLIAPDLNTKDAFLRQKQAEACYNRLKDLMPNEKCKIFNVFLNAPKMTPLMRKWIYLTHRFSRQGVKKTIPYLFQNRPF